MKMKKRYFISLLCVSFGFLFTLAQNPLLRGYADPHMRIFDGKMYISVGKDLSPERKGFTMPYWEIYSSSDLKTWNSEVRINPESTYLPKDRHNNCWATDIVTRNKKYFFYFSNGGKEMGVMVADAPNGPYKDPLNKPFIPADFSANHEYDPTIFIDDNGEYYVIYGRDGGLNGEILHYQIARLNQDMLSLAEAPKDLITDQKYGFGGVNRARDHQYFYKYNGLYYLSCGNMYMTSDNIYGPYTNPRSCGPTGHASFCCYNGQWYHMYEYTCMPYGNRIYRQVSMTYLHYKDNGDMVSDPNFVQSYKAGMPNGRYYHTGVANYSSRWSEIESEWFFKSSGSLKKRECPIGGFEMQNIHNNDYLVFPCITYMKENMQISFNISSQVDTYSKIEIRDSKPDGKLLGVCDISNTGSWSQYKDFTCVLNNTPGTNNLCFIFKGGKGELMRLNKFSLK